MPRLSHQFPVDEVVTAVVDVTADVVDVVEVVNCEVVTDVVEVVSTPVVVEVLVLVEDEQDDNTSEAVIRQVIAIPTIPFFIYLLYLIFDFSYNLF